MTPWLSDPDLDLYVGDVRDILPTLESESVDCVATSPPFFGLRDYGTGEWEGGDPDCDHKPPPRQPRSSRPDAHGFGTRSVLAAQDEGTTAYRDVCGKCGARRADRQIGLEQTPEEWVDALVGVFRECRRVLRPHGTLWIECGDSYAASTKGAGGEGKQHTDVGSIFADRSSAIPAGLKPKDLLLQPFMLAMALRADGWYLRQVIVWAKSNAMPESVRDRCTTAHSYVLLLSKSPRYFFDADAIAEPAEWAAWGAQTDLKRGMNGSTGARGTAMGFDTYGRQRIKEMQGGEGSKNARSVWTVPTSGYPGAHFATFPEKLVERMLLAGCPERVCGTCGKPRERIVERGESTWDARKSNGAPMRYGYSQAESAHVGRADTETVGWSDCGHDNSQPGVILDPFLGSGTTALVARRHGRRTIGVELNESYAAMAAERLQQLSLLA